MKLGCGSGNKPGKGSESTPRINFPGLGYSVIDEYIIPAYASVFTLLRFANFCANVGPPVEGNPFMQVTKVAFR